ncbi:TRAP transporter substrate-binding protein [Oceanibacterium hippocampi]|uniref:Sialic acid-binding periplasmic protein SiaP n=1 Tax=Oceanibacterium hippocampi TaxID=745714 RepID=A0A1Y5S321_9PROT|nr:TRAP transporter substrate-binding protein [Oceanibacterium hippocampi]SLN28917.1 Sialic acid-binding periplasmic protein SiaP precursor [Oceanibacterium hippocampi]
MLKYIKPVAVALAIGLGFSAGAASAETTLRMSSWLPPKHPIVADMMVPWIEEVKKATNGSVNIIILPKALGAAPAHFDLAKDGIADVTFGVHGYQPGRFLLTQAAEVPFLGNSSEAISVAYWRIFEKHLAKANEHEGVKLLALMTHGPGQMFNTQRPITSLADLAGMKIRVGGGLINDLTTALGATALLKPAPASYELISTGVADGVFFPKESIKSFKLASFIKYGTVVPGGLYNVSFFLAMNPAKFEALTKAEQDAIMSVSGEHFAKMAGQAWDRADKAGQADMEAAGVEIIDAPEALVQGIAEKAAPMEAAWIAAAKEKGIDGDMVLKDFRAEIAKLEASN